MAYSKVIIIIIINVHDRQPSVRREYYACTYSLDVSLSEAQHRIGRSSLVAMWHGMVATIWLETVRFGKESIAGFDDDRSHSVRVIPEHKLITDALKSGRPEIDKKVCRVTYDSRTSFYVKRSKVKFKIQRNWKAGYTRRVRAYDKALTRWFLSRAGIADLCRPRYC